MAEKALGKSDGILRNRTVWFQQQQQASGKAGREHSGKKTGGEDLRLMWGGVWNWISHLRAGGRNGEASLPGQNPGSCQILVLVAEGHMEQRILRKRMS